MKKRFKNVLALILAVMMLVSITGCSSKKSEKPVDTSTTTKVEEETSDSAKEKEKVTITMMITSSNVTTNGVQTDPVSKQIELDTGVTMDVTQLGGDEYNNKIAAMIASGDLPDIVTVSSTDTRILDMLMNSKKLLDCTELVQTNGQEFLSNPKLDAAAQFFKTYKSNGENKLYLMPLAVGNQSTPTLPILGPFVRWDVYKAIGYPEVKDLNDYLDVLEKMQKQNPVDDNGKQAYAVSFFTDWGLWPITAPGMMQGYFSVSSSMETSIKDDSTVRSIFSDKNSTFWEWVEFYSKAKQRGILDPDSLTMKNDQYVGKIKSGTTLSIIPSWLTHDYVSVDDPSKGFAPINIFQDSDVFYSNYGQAYGQDLLAITTSCKNPERAMDLLNYFASEKGMELMTNGVQGQTWDLVDGIPTVKKEFIDEMNLKDPGFPDKYGIKYSHLTGLFGSEINPTYSIPYDYKLSPTALVENLLPYEKDCAEHYGVTLPGDIFNNRTYTTYLNPIGPAIPSLPEDIKAIDDKVNAYASTEFMKVILSENDEEFVKNQDIFINDLMAMGYQKYLDWYNAEWTKAYDVISKFNK